MTRLFHWATKRFNPPFLSVSIGDSDLPTTNNASTQTDFRVQIPNSFRFPYPRIAIAANVILNGRHLGQVAEATIEHAH